MFIAVGLGLALAIPIVLPPALFVWYLNSGGILAAIKHARAKRVLRAERS